MPRVFSVRFVLVNAERGDWVPVLLDLPPPPQREKSQAG